MTTVFDKVFKMGQTLQIESEWYGKIAADFKTIANTDDTVNILAHLAQAGLKIPVGCILSIFDCNDRRIILFGTGQRVNITIGETDDYIDIVNSEECFAISDVLQLASALHDNGADYSNYVLTHICARQGIALTA